MPCFYGVALPKVIMDDLELWVSIVILFLSKRLPTFQIQGTINRCPIPHWLFW